MKKVNDKHSKKSVFDEKSLEEIHNEIKQIYLADSRPWVIGYSGGKDSTTVLQLVWYAIKELPIEQRKKTVYVISSDTLVETPIIVDFINRTLKNINDIATKENMPFKAEKLRPLISQSFWVNLIGRGYAAPQQRFRWCTDRLKIQPSNRFIQEKISKYGEVVLILGIRRQESATRKQVMSLYQIPNSVLSRHSKFPRAYVYAPIRDWTTDDVWYYLLQVPSPWGGNNRDLVALYQNAQGECPLVIDDTTPSCGNTRFGCWVCTVVKKDKSISALIESGEEWLGPLLEIRNFLASTQDPKLKQLYREYKRRKGFVSFKSDGSGVISRGPYKLEFCKEILRMVLRAQIEVRAKGPDPNIQLILPEELHEIRRIWRTERGDWEDSLPKIYREITGEDLDWIQDDISFSLNEKSLLIDVCKKHNVPEQLLIKLLDAELQLQGLEKRSSIYNKIDQILFEEWRSEEELLANNVNGINK
ncbi:MAG: DNA phosphorothioation system sulfurtransferase DndC [Nitrososphaerota archaeon]